MKTLLIGQSILTSASLKVHDANSTNIKDYSIFIGDQDNFNYKTTMTEQTFYRLGVKGDRFNYQMIIKLIFNTTSKNCR